MDQSPLSSIDQKLIDVGAYLSEFRDERKVHCLKIFVECMDFVTWIRTYTNSKNHSNLCIASHYCLASTLGYGCTIFGTLTHLYYN